VEALIAGTVVGTEKAQASVLREQEAARRGLQMLEGAGIREFGSSLGRRVTVVLLRLDDKGWSRARRRFYARHHIYVIRGVVRPWRSLKGIPVSQPEICCRGVGGNRERPGPGTA